MAAYVSHHLQLSKQSHFSSVRVSAVNVKSPIPYSRGIFLFPPSGPQGRLHWEFNWLRQGRESETWLALTHLLLPLLHSHFGVESRGLEGIYTFLRDCSQWAFRLFPTSSWLVLLADLAHYLWTQNGQVVVPTALLIGAQCRDALLGIGGLLRDEATSFTCPPANGFTYLLWYSKTLNTLVSGKTMAPTPNYPSQSQMWGPWHIWDLFPILSGTIERQSLSLPAAHCTICPQGSFCLLVTLVWLLKSGDLMSQPEN